MIVKEPATEKLARWGLTGIKVWLVVAALAIAAVAMCCCTVLVLTGGISVKFLSVIGDLFKSY